MLSKRDIELSAKHHKRKVAQEEALKKVTQVKKALPDKITLASWGAGSNKFVERIRKILEE